MGVYIRDMEKPKGCWDCFNYDCDHWGEHGYDNSADCPLIEIDLVKCEECEWSNGECSVGERYQGGCTFGERRTDE